MQAEEPEPQQLLLVDQMPEIGAREARARGAGAVLVQRTRIACEACVAEVETALPRERRARPGGAGRKDAVEHVDAALDHLEDALRIADAHEVAGLAGREERRGPLDGLEHQGAVL